MRKPKRQARAEKPQALIAELVVLKPMDMESLRGHISNLVCASAVDMVTKTVERVKQGQYPAMKYLFEMVGLFPATPLPDAPQEDSLAGMLLSRLGIGDGNEAEGEPANHVK